MAVKAILDRFNTVSTYLIVKDAAKAIEFYQKAFGAESGVGVPGRSEEEWLGLVEARRATGITHLCMRTLGGDLGASGQGRRMSERAVAPPDPGGILRIGVLGIVDEQVDSLDEGAARRPLLGLGEVE